MTETTEVAPTVPETSSPPAVFAHNPSLDGVRAIAVLLVVVAHGTVRLLAPHQWTFVGGIGVGIFFVLSGYLITSLLLRERSSSGRISLRDFYVRRALRIWPLYYAALALHLIVLLHIDSRPWSNVWVSTYSPQYAEFGQVWWSYLIFAQNYVSDLHHVSLGLAVYWSLAIEEQYYLVWPLILIALTSSRMRWRWAVPAFLLGAIVLSFVLRALTIEGHLRETGGGVEWMTHTNIFGLAVGSLLAWSRWDRLRYGGAARGGGGFGATLAWVTVAALVLRWTAPITGTKWAMTLPYAKYCEPLLLSVAVAAIIDYVAAGGTRWSPLRWWPMVYIGRVSYGMYLLHPLVLGVAVHVLGKKGWAEVGIYVLSTLGVAAASYELFEKRILRLKRRFSHVPSSTQSKSIRLSRID
ncbi:acyltransferase family protein [Mycobacterium paraterrae]|uniref:Acyltransferase n=1 Tax=Mycobacterium paraterrae TaxID=577492 RepID=A0ABY3VHX3_9MYCO|nr:acyltransferase [Mycobacterium paraterrae]UMB69025.1 acyltransferase [Mycobacterium paraterrae]